MRLVILEPLAKALNEDQIVGAGIDVYDMEPPIPEDHPLLQAKNYIYTPHIAFATKESMLKRAHIVCDNLKAYIEGNPIHIVH